MRKLGLVVLGLVVLILIGLLVAPSFINVEQFRGRIQAELQQRLGRNVTLGAMHLRLLPPRVTADNIVIGEDPRFTNGGRPFAQAQSLAVSAGLLPLLRREVEIRSLTLERPTVELVRNSAGAWNFASLGEARQAKPSAQQPEAQPGSALTLASLKISDGTVAVTDQQKHQTRAVYDHIDLSLSNFAPGKPFSIEAAAHLPGTGKQTFELDGDAGPINSQNLIDTPVNAKLRLDQVSISSLQKFLNSAALKDIEATITGTARLTNERGGMTSEGSLKFENARLRGIDIGYPITADYKASDDLNSDVIKIDHCTLKLGATPFTVAGTINTRPNPSVLDVHATTQNASIAELARLAAAAGVAFNPNTKVDGRITADVYARGASSKPALSGSVRAQNVVVSGRDLPKPVNVNAVELALSPLQVQSNEFTVSTGGTSLHAQFAMTQYTTPSPMVDLRLSTGGASLAEVLDIARAYGVKAVEGMTGTGRLDLNVRATGPVNTPDAMQFSGSGRLANAALQPATLTQPLRIRDAVLQFTQNSMVMQNLAVELGQTNASGQLTVRNFAAPNVQFSLNADRVNVNELQKVTRPGPPQPGTKESSSALGNVTGGGTVSVGQILYDELALNNVRSAVTLDRGIIRFSPTTAELYGGQESGAIVVDTRTTPPRVELALQLQKVDANKLLSSVSSLKQTLYGMLAANTKANFAVGSSAADIARSLNGTMAINLSNGKLARVDLLNELAAIGKFAGFAQQAQPFTNLVKLTGNFNVANGVAATNDLVAQIEGGSLAATGTAGLVDNALNLRVTAVLGSALSQKVGGTGIGGFMNTALANRNGELVIPVIVTGTFERPRFAPDLQKLAQMKLQNMLPSASNPGAGVLGAILGGPQGQQGQSQQGGLQGILGALGGKKQPPPPGQPVGTPQGDQTTQPPAAQQPPPPPNAGDLLQQLINRTQKKKQPPPPPQQQPPQ